MSQPTTPSPSSPVVVRLPVALATLFPTCPRRVDVWQPVSTVGDVIDELDRRWPGMRQRLTDTTPAVRRHINVFVAGERASLATPVHPGAHVFILLAISGG